MEGSPLPLAGRSYGSHYPKPLTAIHQIEVTSRCNLRCVYCPSPKLDKPRAAGGFGREKVDMSVTVFRRALEWARHFYLQGTQRELALTGVGEALLHPNFVDFVRMSRDALPECTITFSTNGLLLDDDMCARLKPYRPRIYVSTHRPEKAGPAVNAARRAGLLAAINTSFADGNAFDWAGQVDWEVQIPEASIACDYLAKGLGVVLSDGRITRCCLDAAGDGAFGHVDDEIGTLETSPFGLCVDCHMSVP